jgi:microcystin degradation protein MlrC
MSGEVVVVGGFAHETNTFAAAKTDREEFRTREELFGDEIPARLTGTNTTAGGAIDAAAELGVDLRHTVSTWAVPGGVVAADAFEFYTETILDGVRAALPDLDGVLLNLHGAMVPEGMDDGEGPLIARVRELVGEGVPIVVTLDLHGNVTDEMVAEADALVAYESYPHVDMGDTGRNGMRLLARAMRGEVDPVMAVARPPLIAYGPLQNTMAGPMAEIMARAREYEERDAVLKVNVFPGFHQADVPEMGFSVPVVADGDPAAAREVARELAAHIWERRDDLVGDDPEPPEAIAEAKALAADLGPEDGPVVMADLGDNPGGGGAADGTTVLREMLDQGLTNAGFAIMRDPEAVAACADAGVGERVTVSLGGKTDDLHGDPIEDVNGYVKAITDGEFVNTGPMATGSVNDLGRAVHFKCGRDDGIDVILTENRHQPLDAEIWRHVGIQPERLDVLVVKSTNHYRADYEPMASHVIPINSIGLVAEDPRNYDYQRIRRPQYPRDEMADDDYPDW